MGGTNNASTARGFQKIDDIIEDFKKLLKFLQKTYPSASIMVNSLLPRRDSDDKRAKTVNKELVKLGKSQNFTFIDLTDAFSIGGKANDDFFYDHVHLTKLG